MTKEIKEEWVYENGEMYRYHDDGCVSTRPLTPEEIVKALDNNTKRVKKEIIELIDNTFDAHGKKVNIDKLIKSIK